VKQKKTRPDKRGVLINLYCEQKKDKNMKEQETLDVILIFYLFLNLMENLMRCALEVKQIKNLKKKYKKTFYELFITSQSVTHQYFQIKIYSKKDSNLLILPRASDQNLFSLCEKGTQLLLPT
jgi:hypothetical protein